MKSYRFKKIDAFTSGGSEGNPAACVYLNRVSDITDDGMQTIARELKGYVNEVVYLFPEKDGVFLRYFSAECEVDFCGHGTIAAMHDYISSGPQLPKLDVLKIRVKNEYLKVYNRLKQEGSVFITAPAPSYQQLTLSPREISMNLGIDETSIAPGWSLSLVNAGLDTLIVPLSGLRTCLDLKPDEMQLKAFCLGNGIDIVLVFSQETARTGHSFRTRVFAPKFGYLEDPATGSGNSAFGYYLLSQGAWDGRALAIEQNGSFNCPNTVRLSTVEEEGQKRVIFGGSATVRVDGQYLLQG